MVFLFQNLIGWDVDIIAKKISNEHFLGQVFWYKLEFLSDYEIKISVRIIKKYQFNYFIFQILCFLCCSNIYPLKNPIIFYKLQSRNYTSNGTLEFSVCLFSNSLFVQWWKIANKSWLNNSTFADDFASCQKQH